MEAALIDCLSNFGFPVFVALFVLVRVDSTLAKLTAAVNELTKQIAVNY